MMRTLPKVEDKCYSDGAETTMNLWENPFFPILAHAR